MENYRELCLTVPASSVLNILVSVLRQAEYEDYYVYERPPCWYLALGRRASLTVDATGKNAELETLSGKQHFEVKESLSCCARRFINDYGVMGSRIYGHVGFHYALQTRKQPFSPGHWPLLSLTMPGNELIFENDHVTVLAENDTRCRQLCDWLQSAVSVLDQQQGHERIAFEEVADHDSERYCQSVNQALEEIIAGDYNKVILSRTLRLPHPVDMPATLLHGRQLNTPARSFLMRQSGREAVGFCPELVMQVDHGRVVSSPLAGTRLCPDDTDTVNAASENFLQDCKEVVEHVISVKAAVDELNYLCQPGSVVIDDFMSIRHRGSVQHLGSQVSGQLTAGNDAWHAFDTLFPAITATGVPKSAALNAIQRLEPEPRELYSGAILWIEGQQRFEAALVLRSAFQDQQRQWVQAGAGIIAQSTPARELTETQEKLASIVPYLMSKHKKR